MSAPRFTQLVSRAVVLPDADVDTDQIIPARYLKVTDKAGLGEALFADWRARPGFPIGRRDNADAQILLCGPNFGCGSSREHAPWALVAGGFRALVGTSFADIFRGNALKNGLVPVIVPKDVHAALCEAATGFDAPRFAIKIDLAMQVLSAPGVKLTSFTVDAFARRCLLEGVDELGFIQQHQAAIEAYEQRRG